MSIAVVAARLRVLLRRSAALSANQIVRGRLRYDLGSRRCTVDGHEVVLTSREDQVLQRLLLTNGQCLARQELLDEVWGTDSGVDPSIIDIYLRRLRTKLHPAEVENVRGLGYRIGA